MFWNLETNAAQNIFNLFLCSMEGKQRPEPFTRGNLHPTPQKWRNVAQERFFIHMCIGKL